MYEVLASSKAATTKGRRGSADRQNTELRMGSSAWGLAHWKLAHDVTKPTEATRRNRLQKLGPALANAEEHVI